jgi:hypothetical protein
MPNRCLSFCTLRKCTCAFYIKQPKTLCFCVFGCRGVTPTEFPTPSTTPTQPTTYTRTTQNSDTIIIKKAPKIHWRLERKHKIKTTTLGLIHHYPSSGLFLAGRIFFPREYVNPRAARSPPPLLECASRAV